jgi:hypothetical protein
MQRMAIFFNNFNVNNVNAGINSNNVINVNACRGITSNPATVIP